jgi:hypothetical protein
VRVILNHDQERRTDANGIREGLARSYEFRAGLSGSPWTGCLLDVTFTGACTGTAGLSVKTPPVNLDVPTCTIWARSASARCRRAQPFGARHAHGRLRLVLPQAD